MVDRVKGRGKGERRERVCKGKVILAENQQRKILSEVTEG
jgi:hypothetical protein